MSRLTLIYLMQKCPIPNPFKKGNVVKKTSLLSSIRRVTLLG